MTDSRRLEICDGSRAGSPAVGVAFLSCKRRTLTTAFAYADTYLASADAWPIGPDLPFGGQPITAGLPGALADTAPDRWGRSLIDKRIRGEAVAAGRTPPTVTEIDYLLGVSDHTRQGALRYRSAEGMPFLADGGDVPRLVDLPHLLDATDRLSRSGQDDLGAVKELLAAGSASLGGARPKASVQDGDRLLVAKFPHHSDSWDVMAWEATALDLAHACGIAVPVHDLIHVGGRSVLLSERFDRDRDSRIPFISGMTLLSKRDGESADYVEVAEAIGEHGVDVREQLSAIWRRMAFSVAVRNTDDHLRNLGFLRRAGGWVLSPMFDVNPNPAAGERRVTTIGWRNDPAAEIAALVEVAPYFEVEPERVNVILLEIRDGLSGWRAAAAANGLSAADLTMFAPVFDRPLAWR